MHKNTIKELLFRKYRVVSGTILSFILLALPLSAFSQSEENEETPNPVERITTESNGNISIDIPPAIMEYLLQNPSGTKGNSDLKTGINKIAGYRIQVFSDGRNQNSLESRAKARGNTILSKFPKYKGQVYTFSSSPNWFTRIGNFRTAAEANTALTELKKAFPSFAAEMRVVKSQIIVIKQ